MKINHETTEHTTVMTLAGDLVAESVAEFRKSAVAHFGEDVRDFVLDLHPLEYIDSKGLEALIWLQDECGERLGQVRLAEPQETVQTILRLTRLEARFDTHPNVDAAIRSLG